MCSTKTKTPREQQVAERLHAAMANVEKYFSETPVRLDAEFETVYDKGVYVMNLSADSAKEIRARRRKEHWNAVFDRLKSKVT